MFLISANRIGEERKVRFIGRSQIVNCSGNILAEGSESEEQIVKAEIRIEDAREKRVVNIPGEYETNLFGDRRPELYKDIPK